MENKIKSATCRVDQNGVQQGSAFWVTTEHLLTATHVISDESEHALTIHTSYGEEREVEVVHSDSGSDIALLSAQDIPDNSDPLPISAEIPEIGKEVLWSGYARLFGEDNLIDRQRFGWGRVASEKYDKNGGMFFEIDGNFNPSHSGGPVVEKESGQVVGIISESAGDFTKVVDRVENRIEPIIQIREFLEKNRDRSGTLNQGFTYEDPAQAAKDKHFLEGLGFNVHSRENQNGDKVNYLNTEEITLRTTELQADLSEILFNSLHGTVQMGIGVATGGEELEQHIPVDNYH